MIDQKDAKIRDNMLKMRKVFVGGLSELVTEEDLSQYFSQFGVVENIILSREHYTNKSRCCGFVVFKDQESAHRTLRHKKAHFLRGKYFGCKPCKLRSEVQPKALQNTGSAPFVNQDPNLPPQGMEMGPHNNQQQFPPQRNSYNQGHPSSNNLPSNSMSQSSLPPSEIRNRRPERNREPYDQPELQSQRSQRKNQKRLHANDRESRGGNGGRNNNSNRNNKNNNRNYNGNNRPPMDWREVKNLQNSRINRQRRKNQKEYEFYMPTLFGKRRLYNTEGIRMSIKDSITAQQFSVRTQLRGTNIQLTEQEFNFMMVAQNFNLFNFMNIPILFPFDEPEPKIELPDDNLWGNQGKSRNRKTQPKRRLRVSDRTDSSEDIELEDDQQGVEEIADWWAELEEQAEESVAGSEAKTTN